ncbi:MAG: ABC transporter ATP-binding protein [Pseudomonadales bacterium]|jgi:ABC-2 type transport system ATP-binding protein|nr:ABC transporter ATP-binding protein [Pseudomonadales bacterium]MDP7357564.1 ABC transporter ATP-binding protein [Pseudomonadales bacterium]MDP7596548.1 ABC transporter ATP-binding protein [Pseudomonadales bacterium]HJN51073.1 ABC transporter ATP-binding protein [Pseudomonadales bacterium]
MNYAIEFAGLTKRFEQVAVLDDVTLTIGKSSLVGLLGRNGSGKTTLLRHVVGQLLPTAGIAETLGRTTSDLRRDEFERIGFVPQEIRLLDWMTVSQHISYVRGFYKRWDSERESRLLDELELDGNMQVGALSTGDVQKLAVVLAVCHHPELLILDEPVSNLDPIARSLMLEFLLEVTREDDATIVISSHVLRDVERIVDWVVCLNHGRVMTDEALDELKERYAEWHVTKQDGKLPASFTESFVVEQEVNGREARVIVRSDGADAESFRAAYSCELVVRALNLEQLFPVLIGGDQA